MEPMKILLTNDDGIHAPGLWALHDALAQRHDVTVVAPDRERSAVSHGITLNEPLRLVEVTLRGGHTGQMVNGTPADCVKLGILEVLGEKPEMVISGINPGANVGIAIHYSGTVSAAREAALYGIPAMAVSINARQVQHWDTAARYAAHIAEAVHRQGLPFGTLLNINVPDLPAEAIAGMRASRQGVSVITEYFEKRVDPRNRAYHWLGGDIQTFDDDMAIDWTALSGNHVTVTPLQCDVTDYRTLEQMRDWTLFSEKEPRP